MAQQTTQDHLNDFKAEVSRSAVISDHFKDWLVAQMTTMASIAYRKGHQDGIKEERKAARKKKGR